MNEIAFFTISARAIMFQKPDSILWLADLKVKFENTEYIHSLLHHKTIIFHDTTDININ